MNEKERFLDLCERLISRPGIDSLLTWLKFDTDFFAAPASSRFHLAETGGLCKHSLYVYEELKRLIAAYPEIQTSEETLAIIALFHDLCKVNFYGVELRNRKNEFGQWEQYEVFTPNEQFKFGGHGSKSVYLVMKHMKLTDEEAVAINCHMSCWNGDTNVGTTYEQYPLAWLLHVADEAATYVRERKGGK